MAPNQYPNGPVAPARQGGMMKGREGYPDASQMPEIDDTPVNPADAPDDMKDLNPIVDALQTLQQFVMAKEQAGDPAAGELKSTLLSFVQKIASAPPAAGEGSTPPPPGAEAGTAGTPPAGPEAPMPKKPGESPMSDMPGEEAAPGDTGEDLAEGENPNAEDEMATMMKKKGMRPMGNTPKGAMMRKLGRDMNQGKNSVPLI